MKSPSIRAGRLNSVLIARISDSSRRRCRKQRSNLTALAAPAVRCIRTPPTTPALPSTIFTSHSHCRPAI